MKRAEFLEQVAQLAASFRRKIELEVEAFPIDAEARAARVRKVRDPVAGYRYFAETYFPHYLTHAPSKLHLDLYRQIPEMLAAEGGELRLVIAPRGSAKSSHGSMLAPLWAIVTGQKHYVCVIMDVFEQAAVMIEAIKAELEVNPRLAYDFPDMVGQGGTWREGAITTRSNVKVEAFGSGKKIRGRRHGPYRPDLVVLDDVENDENVESPHQRNKLETWITKAVLKLGPTDGSMDVLYMGTILHHDAVIVRFARRPRWKVSKFQALIAMPDRMDLWDAWEELYLNDEEAADAFLEEHREAMHEGAVVNWPELHPLEYLMAERAGDHDSFESEYQNNPISGSNAFRKPVYWVVVQRDLVKFGAIDPSLGKAGAARDPSAILVGGWDRQEGRLDVIEASIRKRLPDGIIDDAMAMQRAHGCALWFVEAVQFQEMLRTELMKRAAIAGLAMPCLPVTPFADKVLRVERLQPPFASGLIRLHASQRTLIDQLQQWPSAQHDDGPDALEMLWTGAVQYGGQAAGTTSIHLGTPAAAPELTYG